jgi:hypothetical protein
MWTTQGRCPHAHRPNSSSKKQLDQVKGEPEPATNLHGLGRGLTDGVHLTLTTRGIDPSEDEEVQIHEIERHTPSRLDDARRDEMKTPEDVTAMARLKSLGWGARRM